MAGTNGKTAHLAPADTTVKLSTRQLIERSLAVLAGQSIHLFGETQVDSEPGIPQDIWQQGLKKSL